jgi:ATP-dependent DNA helicase RecG
VVIDEQHRFGVVQRATLRAKGLQPDVLGDDGDADSPNARADGVRRSGLCSVIRDLPPGRQRIVTLARPESRRR